MATLTKVIKPVSDYVEWVASGVSDGDILGVYESLGNRSAHSVTIESVDGPSIIRFNVTKQIFGDYGPNDQYAGLGHGLARPRPYLLGEIEQVKDNIFLTAGETQSWTSAEIAISDIKIITNSGLRITVT